MRLLIGATQLTEPGPEAQVRLIKRLLIHKEYGPADQSNDIALLELNEPVQCSSHIQLACVPNATVNVAQLDTCYVAGWGATTARCEFPKMEGKLNTLGRWVGLPDSGGQGQNKAARSLKADSTSIEAQPNPREGSTSRWGKWQQAASSSFLSVFTAQKSSDILQEAKVHLINVQICNSTGWYKGDVHSHNLCAGYPEGGIDTCQVGASLSDKSLSPQQHRQHHPNTAQPLLSLASHSLSPGSPPLLGIPTHPPCAGPSPGPPLSLRPGTLPRKSW